MLSITRIANNLNYSRVLLKLYSNHKELQVIAKNHLDCRLIELIHLLKSDFHISARSRQESQENTAIFVVGLYWRQNPKNGRWSPRASGRKVTLLVNSHLVYVKKTSKINWESAIGQHLITNSECAKTHTEDNFWSLGKQDRPFI